MKDLSHNIILYITIIFLVGVIFLQRSCAPQIAKYNAKQEILIPKKEGKFLKSTLVVKEKPKKDSIVWRDKVIKTENSINKKLANDYIQAQKENDSLKALKLYLGAIEEHEEKYTFDDKNLKLEVSTKTRGKILSILPKYEIKEKKEIVDVIQKETKFALYTGVSLEYITDINRLTPKISLGIQNKKGDILSIESGLDKSIQVGYSVRLINLKK